MNPNDPVFPCQLNGTTAFSGQPTIEEYEGLTKREYIAIQAMQGLLVHATETPEEVSRLAVAHADALIAALQEEEG